MSLLRFLIPALVLLTPLAASAQGGPATPPEPAPPAAAESTPTLPWSLQARFGAALGDNAFYTPIGLSADYALQPWVSVGLLVEASLSGKVDSSDTCSSTGECYAPYERYAARGVFRIAPKSIVDGWAAAVVGARRAHVDKTSPTEPTRTETELVMDLGAELGLDVRPADSFVVGLHGSIATALPSQDSVGTLFGVNVHIGARF